MEENELAYDVVVVGAGNAALCAALSAQEHGAGVLVLEKAPPSAQGGNCPYTGGGFRFVHEGIEDLRSLLPDLTDNQVNNINMGPYTAQDFKTHLMTVTHGETDPELMEVIIAESRPTVEWMQSKGVTWELSDRANQITSAPSTIPSSVGLTAWQSGVGLIQMLTTACRRASVQIVYETKMLRLLQDSRGGVCGVTVQDVDGVHDIRSQGVVLACGGFEANQVDAAQVFGHRLGKGQGAWGQITTPATGTVPPWRLAPSRLGSGPGAMRPPLISTLRLPEYWRPPIRCPGVPIRWASQSILRGGVSLTRAKGLLSRLL